MIFTGRGKLVDLNPLTLQTEPRGPGCRGSLFKIPPDYVFEPDYRLLSLEEVQAYIEQHKHLPEVPSAKEMKKNGVDVGEMEMVLLKKIEELTLYVIDLKQENKSIKAENDELKKLILERLSALENKSDNK